MLTKIEKLVVEDIRIFSGRHEYEFEKGITHNRIGITEV